MSPAERRSILFQRHQIDVLLDVGANAGQYARWARRLGFAGRIVSFEPQLGVFEDLRRAAAGDRSWSTRRVALGERNGPAEIQVAQDPVASSILRAEQLNVDVDRGAEQVGSEVVAMTCLASVWPELVRSDERVYLKLDVEGYEMNVLRGAEPVLHRVEVIEAELALVPMFVGAPLLPEVVAYLQQRGFAILALENNHEDSPDGQMVMVDGLFIRREGGGASPRRG